MEGRRYEFPEFVVRRLVYPAGRRMARHAHPYSNVTAVIRGEMIEETELAEHRGRSCSVLLKPAGTAHADAFVGRTGVATISIELAAGSPFPIAAWEWAEDTDAARAALDLCHAVKGDCREVVESSAYAMLACVLTRPAASGSAPAWLRQMLDALQTRFDEPMRFENLAREAGLHPVYVSRAFRRFTRRNS